MHHPHSGCTIRQPYSPNAEEVMIDYPPSIWIGWATAPFYGETKIARKIKSLRLGLSPCLALFSHIMLYDNELFQVQWGLITPCSPRRDGIRKATSPSNVDVGISLLDHYRVTLRVILISLQCFWYPPCIIPIKRFDRGFKRENCLGPRRTYGILGLGCSLFTRRY